MDRQDRAWGPQPQVAPRVLGAGPEGAVLQTPCWLFGEELGA